VSKAVLDELKKLIRESKIMECACLLSSFIQVVTRFHCRCDDTKWPEPDASGTQELEVVLDNEHISFTVRPSFF